MRDYPFTVPANDQLPLYAAGRTVRAKTLSDPIRVQGPNGVDFLLGQGNKATLPTDFGRESLRLVNDTGSDISGILTIFSVGGDFEDVPTLQGEVEIDQSGGPLVVEGDKGNDCVPTTIYGHLGTRSVFAVNENEQGGTAPGSYFGLLVSMGARYANPVQPRSVLDIDGAQGGDAFSVSTAISGGSGYYPLLQAADNPTGLRIYDLYIASENQTTFASGSTMELVAATSAAAGASGDVLITVRMASADGAFNDGRINRVIEIPAGLGLYYSRSNAARWAHAIVEQI